jgi:hypothetical protein
MSNVVRLELREVGEGFRFDPDAILEEAKGKGFTNLVIVGELPDDDEVYVAGMANAGESIIMMERAKLQIIRS